MALDNLNLCIAYTRAVKKSVGQGVKADVQMSDEARDGKGEKDTQLSFHPSIFINQSDKIAEVHKTKC